MIIFADMTPEELKSELDKTDLPDTFRLSAWENIGNVRTFLDTQFQLVEQAGMSYERTPAWDRLMRFRKAVSGD